MAQRQVALEGMPELIRAFNEVGLLGQSDEAYDITKTAATVIWKAIRDRAPVGPTGNLKNAVIVFRMPKKEALQPASMVRIRTRKGTGPLGTHFYWIEYGTALMRHPKFKKALSFVINGVKFVRWEVGPIPARPFFRPGLDASRDHALKVLEREALDMIERHYAKG